MKSDPVIFEASLAGVGRNVQGPMAQKVMRLRLTFEEDRAHDLMCAAYLE